MPGASQLVLASRWPARSSRDGSSTRGDVGLIDRHHATGLVVVPVMFFDRIMDLPAEIETATMAGRCGSPPRRVPCGPMS